MRNEFSTLSAIRLQADLPRGSSMKATLPRPKAPEVNTDRISAALKEPRRWVCWRFEPRDGKWTKVPINPANGRQADSTNPATWGKLETAICYYLSHRDDKQRPIDGIGFVLGDGFAGVDLDNCLDDEGYLKPWARPLVEHLALHTYGEISPSGRGLKFFAQITGELPGQRCKQKPYGDETGAVEIYSTDRYFTVTGDHWPESQFDVADCSDGLAAVYRVVFPDSNNGHYKPPIPSKPADASDAEIVADCERLIGDDFRAAWGADLAPFGNDDSKADYRLAKCFIWRLGNDPSRIESLMRQSALARPKWDEMRRGETYIGRTIAKAIEKTHKFFEARPSRNGKAKTPGEPEPDAADDNVAAPETEFALAEELIRRYGADLRYCGEHKCWYVFDGKRFAEDVTGQAQERSKSTSKAIYREAIKELKKLAEQLKNSGDEEKAKLEMQIGFVKKRFAWARNSQTRKVVAAVLAIASSAPGIAIQSADLDRDPWLLNCGNGTIDLRTGTLRPHNRADLITKLAPVDFDAEAEAPTWERFLNSIFPLPEDQLGDAAEEWPGNEKLISFLHRALGYAITGTVTEHILLVFHGTGANGKSVLIEAVLHPLGEYGMSAPPTLLMVKDHAAHPTELADLFGRRLVTTCETSAGAYLDEALVKWLTGGDTLRARRMREDFWAFAPTHQVILTTNHAPRLRNAHDEAMQRRLRMVPFGERFWNPDVPPEPGELRPENRRRDPKLLEKLKAEAPGILAWLVRGCLEWQQQGLGSAAEVAEATRDYIAAEDVLADFLADRCKLHRECKVKASALYRAFGEWAKSRGEFVLTYRDFASRLGKRPGIEKYLNNGTWYSGIGLVDADGYGP